MVENPGGSFQRHPHHGEQGRGARRRQTLLTTTVTADDSSDHRGRPCASAFQRWSQLPMRPSLCVPSAQVETPRSGATTPQAP